MTSISPLTAASLQNETARGPPGRISSTFVLPKNFLWSEISVWSCMLNC